MSTPGESEGEYNYGHPDLNLQHNNKMDENETVVLNIGGIKYEVLPSTLCKYPDTLLGQLFNPANKHMLKPDKKGEYFFDRNGRVFEVILNFYRTGKLVIPNEIPQELLREELKYFKLEYNEGDNGKDNEDEKIMKLPRDQIYNYANSLIHSASKFDVKRGLYFLQKLRELDNNSYLYKYSMAFAYYRLGMNKEGIETLEEILTNDPNNPQAKSLLTLFNDSRVTNVRIGLVAVGLLIVGAFGFWKLRSWMIKRAARTVASTAATFISNNAPTAASVVAQHPIVQSQVANAALNALQQTTTELIKESTLNSNTTATTVASITTAAPKIISGIAKQTASTVASAASNQVSDPSNSQVFMDAMNSALPQLKK